LLGCNGLYVLIRLVLLPRAFVHHRPVARIQPVLGLDQRPRCVLESGAAVDWPQQGCDQRVDQDTKRGLLGTQYCGGKRIGRVGAAIESNDRAGETGQKPEVGALAHAHPVGAKANPPGQRHHEQPAVLYEQRNNEQRHRQRKQRPQHAHGALVQGLADG